MKDFTNWQPDPTRVEPIREKFLEGESSAQEAFRDLVQYILDELEAHRDGTNPAPRGLQTAVRDGLIKAGFGEQGSLSKSYLSPSLGIASAIHRGKASIPLLAIWEDFFVQTGEGLEGSVTRGPLFTPGRLNAAWGRLNSSKDNPFRAEVDGIVAETPEGDRPWHTLTIKDLRAINARGKPDPEALQVLLKVVGDPSKPDKKPGALMRIVSSMRSENEKMRSEVVAEFCDRLEAFFEELREDTAVTIEAVREEEARRRRIAAEERRIQRAKQREGAPILARQTLGGEPVTEDPEPEDTDSED